MRKGFGLIELVFTMVIIAFAFSAIPVMIKVSNKAVALSKKEDAIFNMMAKAIDISSKEYDEKNVDYDGILIVNDPPLHVLDCNASSWYRIGGFVGGRNCRDKIFESSTFSDPGEPPYDDVDDYDGLEENTTQSGHTVYTLKVSVGYTDEWHKGDYSSKKLEYNFTSTSNTNLTNVKRISLEIYRDSKRISSVKYYSANIGHIKVQSELW